MALWQRFLVVLGLPAALACTLAAAQQPATPSTPDAPPAAKQPRPIPKGRVFVWDLEGTWISKSYMEQLQATRSPNAAGRKTPPLVIKVQRDAHVYPMVITDFHEAVMQFLIEVEPGKKPSTYRLVVAPEEGMVSSTEVTYVPVSGQKNEQGKFEKLTISDPFLGKKKPTLFVRLPQALEPWVNRLVLAGKYKDEQGRSYEFTDAGDAVMPDRTFPYEIALDAKSGTCDLLHSHREKAPEGKERIGFAWKDKKLMLYGVNVQKNDRYSCDAKPIAVLTPQSDA